MIKNLESVCMQQTKASMELELAVVREDAAAVGGSVIANLRLTLILLILLLTSTNGPLSTVQWPLPLPCSFAHHDLTCALKETPVDLSLLAIPQFS